MTDIPKPKQKISDPHYVWSEIATYIRLKYKRDIRDWAKSHTNYQDFWHHLTDIHEVRNGAIITIVPEEAMDDVDMPDWQKEIYTILRDEFGDEFDVLTSW